MEIVESRQDRLQIVIDLEWLRFASTHQSTIAIARFLGVGVSTVRTALLEYGISQPGWNPFPTPNPDNCDLDYNTLADNDLLDPHIPDSDTIPDSLYAHHIPIQQSEQISTIDNLSLDARI